VPLNKEPLPLPPDPESVRRARAWVHDVLERLGRSELVDAAELAVSELVTNAILHGEPPITVRVRGTRAHPRVEVRDHSHRPPEVNVEMTEEENLLSTIGRGLGIVALYSETWGADLRADGKTVWFEPAHDPSTTSGLQGAVFDFEQTVEERLAAREAFGELLQVRLLDMPVQVFAHFRRRYEELGRELRLLSLAHGDDYPVASELTELFLQVEQERRVARGVSRLDEAIEQGLDRVDLDYRVPHTTPTSMARLLEMLERADEFCREQRLLVLAASPQQLALQRWYFTEFSRQAAGEEPLPWPGSFTLDEPPLAT
jgi:anti-sigma regulatory factor (Ser/Thr protein kinase)